MRQLKRTLKAAERTDAALASMALARDAATALLERSIKFGHRRLAIIRLHAVVNVGGKASPDQWAYCREAAARSNDHKLKDLLAQAQCLDNARLRAAAEPRG